MSDNMSGESERVGLLDEDEEAGASPRPPPPKAIEDDEPMDPNKMAANFTETKEMTNLRTWWGACYATAMSVCGIVLVALGSTLSSLAADCGTTATAVGTVFIARGAGAICGAVFSAKLYAPPRKGNLIMVVVMLALSMVLLYMPFVDKIWSLHFCWFCMGLCTATLDTGCQIMTRKVHGVLAGPWLGLNTVVFAIAGALVPLVEIITESLFVQYAVLATVSACGAAFLFASPHPESPEIVAQLPPKVRIQGKNGKKSRSEGKYHTEMLFGATVFWLIGGKVDITSYVKTYVKASGVIPNDDSSEALLVIWIMITVGRLVGLQDQIALKKRSTHAVYAHLAVWCLIGVVGMMLIVVDLKSSFLFWVGMSLYGLGNGPCVGYCYDLINRLTTATEEGMSIVMFGLNFGASLVPYVTTVIWDDTPLSYNSLMFMTLASMLVPLPLLVISRLVQPKGVLGASGDNLCAPCYGKKDLQG